MKREDGGRLYTRKMPVVYGPYRSRRLGNSLGINLNGLSGKTCNYNCVYCEFGPTIYLVSSTDEITYWMDESKILEEVERWLSGLNKQNLELNSITFSGYGEPTLYPCLKEIIRGVKRMRDEYYPGVQVKILTNASTITEKDVFEALTETDSVLAKLDAGSQEIFKAINRPVRAVPTLESIVDNILKLQDVTNKVTLQTLIFRSIKPDQPDNSDMEEIIRIGKNVRRIEPVEIQVYTVNRLPSELYVVPMNESSLLEVTSVINEMANKKLAKLYF